MNRDDNEPGADTARQLGWSQATDHIACANHADTSPVQIMQRIDTLMLESEGRHAAEWPHQVLVRMGVRHASDQQTARLQ